MTGHTPAERRAAIWSQPHKRIFFCTPQVFKNDACSGESSSAAGLPSHFPGCLNGAQALSPEMLPDAIMHTQ